MQVSKRFGLVQSRQQAWRLAPSRATFDQIDPGVHAVDIGAFAKKCDFDILETCPFLDDVDRVAKDYESLAQFISAEKYDLGDWQRPCRRARRIGLRAHPDNIL